MRVIRMVAGVAVVLVGGVVGLSMFASSAHADSGGIEAEFVARINALRANSGLAPLSVDMELTYVARVWSAQMATSNVLAHNWVLPQQVTRWQRLGENVGDGPTVDSLEVAFEASPHHYENLMDPGFRMIGVGVVEANGLIWVTEDFKQAKVAPVFVPALASAVTPAPATPPAPAATLWSTPGFVSANAQPPKIAGRVMSRTRVSRLAVLAGADDGTHQGLRRLPKPGTQ